MARSTWLSRAAVGGVTGTVPIVVGHGLKVAAPAIVDPTKPAKVTTTFTNPGAAVRNVALSLTLPAGWTATPTTAAAFATVDAKATVSTTWAVRPGVGGGEQTRTADASVGGVHDSTATIDVDVAFSRLAAAFDNTGSSPDGNHGVGDFDGNGSSFSAEALAANGISAGAKITHNGYTFAWPDGGPNNVAAGGQTIALAAGGTSLGFIGASTYGTQTGTVTLSFADWYGNQPAAGGDVVTTMPYINTNGGNNTGSYSLYFTSVPLAAGKTLQYVTLPDISHGTSAGWPSMHIFTIAAKNDSLAVTAPPIADPGTSITVTTKYTNVGSTAANAVTLTLSGWPATASSPASFDTVAPGASVQTTWQVKVPADVKPGNANLVAGGPATTSVVQVAVPGTSQGPSQHRHPFDVFPHGHLSGRGDGGRAVEGTGKQVQLNGYAGGEQCLRVGDGLVPQRIVLHHRDVRRRQPGQVGGARRGGVGGNGVAAAHPRSQVGVPAADRVLPAEHRRVHELDHGTGDQPVVELRNVQVLEGDRRPAAVTGQQGEPGGQPTAGADAVQRDARRVHGWMLGQPGQRGVAVLDRRREAVLGGEPVVHRHDHGPDRTGQVGVQAVVGVQVADREAARVHGQDAGQPGPPLGLVHAQADVRPDQLVADGQAGEIGGRLEVLELGQPGPAGGDVGGTGERGDRGEGRGQRRLDSVLRGNAHRCALFGAGKARGNTRKSSVHYVTGREMLDHMVKGFCLRRIACSRAISSTSVLAASFRVCGSKRDSGAETV